MLKHVGVFVCACFKCILQLGNRPLSKHGNALKNMHIRSCMGICKARPHLLIIKTIFEKKKKTFKGIG